MYEHDRVGSHKAQRALSRLRLARLEGLAIRIAEEHGVDVMDVLNDRRYKSISIARQHLAAIIRWTLGLSYPEIGYILGVDHTTVMYAEIAHGSRVEAGISGEWSALLKVKRDRDKHKQATRDDAPRHPA